jgi:DNA-binding GntR family transcriptional regulator
MSAFVSDRMMLLGRHPSVEENVVDMMRSDIVRLVLAPGQRLALEEFGERYHASLTPLRQALRQLKTEGFVTFHPRKGSFVAALTVDDLEIISTVSSALESKLTKLGVPLLTTEDRRQLRTLVRARAEAAAAEDLDGIYAAAWRARDIIGRRSGRDSLLRESVNWRARMERYQRFLRTSTINKRNDARWAEDFSHFIETALDGDEEAAAAATVATVEWGVLVIAELLQENSRLYDSAPEAATSSRSV